jgi:flagellar M-ring protein FliF
MVGLGLLVLLGLVRPGMKLLQAPPVTLTPIKNQQQLSAVLNETPDRPGLPMPGALAPPLPEHLRLEDAKRLAKENPMAVASIVKGWVNGEVPV